MSALARTGRAPCETAIVVVAFNGRGHLPVSLGSCRDHARGAAVFVVDNASADGSADLVRRSFPEALVLPQSCNLGFGGGCNVGIRAAFEAGARWILLLNQDAELTEGAVPALVRVLETTPDAAAVQPAILHPDGHVNTLGNPVHYLGFSMAGGDGLTLDQAAHDPSLPWLHDGRWRAQPVQVPACSGAATLLRAEALLDVGLFEELLFLYHEDLELSLRLRRAGWTLWLCANARAVHHYAFRRNPGKWYFLERNRTWVLLAHYRARTLALLALPFIAAEGAVWALALQQGWGHEKARACGYWLDRGHWRVLRERRRELAGLRRVDDAELLAPAATRLISAETRSAFADRVVNPGSALLWRLLQPLLRW